MSLQLFIDKLSALANLEDAEKAALLALPFTKRHVPANRDLIGKGDHPHYLYVVLEGWAGRYNLRPDGSRRITGLMLPGDFCGIHAVCHAPMDHGITAFTNCQLGQVELHDFEAGASTSPAIVRALWQSKLADEAILRMWLLNSTDASRTLAHLFCEIDARLHPTDKANERSFRLPLTQEQIGDVIGITSVHTNRTVRQLREAGLVNMSAGTLHIPDVAALRREASFDPRYLYWRA